MNNSGKKYVYGTLKRENFWKEETVLPGQNGFLMWILMWLKKLHFFFKH